MDSTRDTLITAIAYGIGLVGLTSWLYVVVQLAKLIGGEA